MGVELLDQPVTVARFDLSADAHVAKCALEGAGIDCALVDEEIVSLDWFYSLMMGGIKLRVRQSEATLAREILTTGLVQDDSGVPVEPAEQEQRPRCPRCGAADVIHERIWHRFAMGSLFVLGIPIPIPRNGWKCRKCCREWRA
ncbi:MAG TPA: hypothetical protein VNL17_16690 [Verrucomicrobiae bacterium]|nr:hypothetical protein [Verrucomicrobiae bacterium]